MFPLPLTFTICAPGDASAAAEKFRAGSGRRAADILRTVKRNVLKAILTDSHFWLPLAVLLLGVALLVRLA